MRDYRFLAPFGALTIVKKTRTPGWGIDGGLPGPKNVSILASAPGSGGADKSMTQPYCWIYQGGAAGKTSQMANAMAWTPA